MTYRYSEEVLNAYMQISHRFTGVKFLSLDFLKHKTAHKIAIIGYSHVLNMRMETEREGNTIIFTFTSMSGADPGPRMVEICRGEGWQPRLAVLEALLSRGTTHIRSSTTVQDRVCTRDSIEAFEIVVIDWYFVSGLFSTSGNTYLANMHVRYM